jgi:hypothetical protein
MEDNQFAAPHNEPWIDSRTAGARFGRHYKTLELKARKGLLPAYKKFNRWYFLASELDAWLRIELNSAPAKPCRVN